MQFFFLLKSYLFLWNSASSDHFWPLLARKKNNWDIQGAAVAAAVVFWSYDCDLSLFRPYTLATFNIIHYHLTISYPPYGDYVCRSKCIPHMLYSYTVHFIYTHWFKFLLSYHIYHCITAVYHFCIIPLFTKYFTRSLSICFEIHTLHTHFISQTTQPKNSCSTLLQNPPKDVFYIVLHSSHDQILLAQARARSDHGHSCIPPFFKRFEHQITLDQHHSKCSIFPILFLKKFTFLTSLKSNFFWGNSASTDHFWPLLAREKSHKKCIFFIFLYLDLPPAKILLSPAAASWPLRPSATFFFLKNHFFFFSNSAIPDHFWSLLARFFFSNFFFSQKCIFFTFFCTFWVSPQPKKC